MDFLKYGMKYEKSGSKLQRIVAKCLLKTEQWKADRYEEYLEKKQIAIPDDEEGTKAMLRSIYEQTGQPEEDQARGGPG